MQRYLAAFGVGLLSLFLASCGGNSPGNGGSNPAPPPSFAVLFSPASVTLAQGGASQTVQASVSAQNNFTDSVSLTMGSLPSGVTASPAALTLTPGAPGNFTLSASSTAEISQQSVNVSAVGGSLSLDASFQLTVTGAPVPDPFHMVGGSLVHGFYDESRNLLFATNLGRNELDVISGQDFSIKARVPVPQPLGIDQMADGVTLVIGTLAQEVVTVNEDTLSVTLHPYSAAGGFFSLFFPNVVALANGKVLMIGQEQGVDSGDIVDGGQFIYEWDSTTDTFSQVEPTAQNANGTWETDSLARSADHKWAVFAGDQFYLYSSDSDSLTSVPLSVVNPPANEYGVRGYAVNADGTEIAVASAGQVTFLDRSLSALATTPIPGAFQTARTAVQFTPDGSKLLLQYDLPLAIEEIDASSHSALGYVSGTVILEQDNLERLLATDAKGHAYVGIDGGLRLVDLSQPPVPNPSTGNLAGPNCPVLSAVLPLNTSRQLPLSIPFTSASVYVGGKPAPLLSNGTAIIIPSSSIAGPADVECIDPSGNTSVILNGASYGVDPIALSANLLPPTGNPEAYLYGFGFFASQGETPAVTLGGLPPVTVVGVNSVGPETGTLQGEAFTVPNGTPGELADVDVSSSLGDGTLASAATYYAQPTVVPASGLLQLLYDSHRDLLYALKATEVGVLDPTTLQWQTPLAFPPAATGVYNTMALTPDGSKLVVAGSDGSAPQFIVLDPDNASPPSVVTYSGVANLSGSIAVTMYNTVVMPGNPGLVLDLSTSTFTQLPYFGGDVIRASADGSHLYSAQLNTTSGQVSSIDPATYAVHSEGFGFLFWTDLAVSPDGSQFAAVDAPPNSAGDIAGFFDSGLHLVNVNVYPEFSPPDDTGVLGATFSPQGKVLLVPLGDSIELWDASHGTLRARLMTPEELHALVYPEGAVAPMLALDPSGQTIYAISSSGLTVLKLPEPLDQVPQMQWALTVRPPGEKAWLHGTITSRMAAMHSKPPK